MWLKKIKEEEYVRKEKMESIGMLAGGIAHDFNNLLTGVLGYASLIKNFLSNEEKLYRYAEAIESSAQRAQNSRNISSIFQGGREGFLELWTSICSLKTSSFS